MNGSGSSKYHLLVWDDSAIGMCWEPSTALNIPGSESINEYSCNTRKVCVPLEQILFPIFMWSFNFVGQR